MTDRQERLETARKSLANAVQLLLGGESPTGPNMSDLTVAGELVGIIQRLAPEEQVSAQLRKVDDELGWKGTDRGRIETIKRLKIGGRLNDLQAR